MTQNPQHHHAVIPWLATLLLVGCVFLLAVAPALFAQDQPVATRAVQSHTEWLAGIVKQTGALKPGISRQDFENTFHRDGGISGLEAQRYCHRDCPYIKVDVAFTVAKDSQTPFTDPDAKLTKISKPYLETPYRD